MLYVAKNILKNLLSFKKLIFNLLKYNVKVENAQ
jgi:hypothetical protein